MSPLAFTATNYKFQSLIPKGNMMIGATATPSNCLQYELEIEIEASCEEVWKAIFEDTNSWWIPDFHIVGPDSVVSFDPVPGGRGLVEDKPDGDSLQWYTVQMYLPSQFAIHLVGFIAPEWGGPTTSCLKLSVVPNEQTAGCIFKVTDARHGNVDEKHLQGNKDGWLALFTDGLKKYVEESVGG